ncbi:hypothetical protein A6A08_20560 [Nocardiopsis sp. TSRI0078]|uniref:hypothetical protein n=1 Tax=unclassified Nocardiopsis TaxID=2649073 RepID=UPI00093CF918|nr:hypothetical protein [Nocardiopsis sp. TSRI0078]OKI21976.1 hypothetical protein A6A08_20560 [Nocardiopsis sp. TSRI0078]
MSAQRQSPSDPAPRPPEEPAPAAAVPAAPSTWWLTGASLTMAGAAVVLLSGEAAVWGGPEPATAAVTVQRPDADRVGALVEHTRTAHEELVPVVEAMEEFLPTDGSHPPLEPTDPSVVHSWRTGVREAADRFGEPSGGDTVHEATQAGMASSVQLLSMSVEAYAGAALVEDEDLRMDTLHIAMDLRDQAVHSWSVAATHLDLASVDSGHGHVHLYLPAPPDGGALRPDGAEPGSGRAPASGGGHDH